MREPEGRLFMFDVPGILRGAAIKKHHGEEAFINCRDHHECLIYANYCDWLKTQRMTDPAAARSGAAPQLKKDEDDQARVAPSVPCVAPTGSTAERPMGAVTAAERPEEEHELRRLLWANHQCSPAGLYGDDGEMQCNAEHLNGDGHGIGPLDFKRDSVHYLASAICSMLRYEHQRAELAKHERAALAAARLALQQENAELKMRLARGGNQA